MGRIKAFVITFFSAGLLVLFFVPTTWSADLGLSVPEKTQVLNQWCWAGSDQAILEYYGTVQAQCTIANWALGRSDCCGPYVYNVVNQCNQAIPMSGASRSIQGILTHWGVNSVEQSGALSQTTIVSEINAGRPFVIGFRYFINSWPDTGHAVVGYGYELNGLYIKYMDPGSGYRSDSYTLLLSAYLGSLTELRWERTLRSTTNPRSACESGFASDISSNGATLKGTVNGYPDSTVSFEYGTTTSYGSTVVANISSVPGSAIIMASKTITGLAPNTLYHFRAKATNSAGYLFGVDQTFTTAPISVSVNTLGTGTGTVSKICYNFPVVDCVLTATAAPGSAFTGWSGDCSGTGDCYLLMLGNRSVTATFMLLEALTISKSGTGTGTITSSPPGISCGSTCSNSFVQNTQLTLTASPDSGSVFSGWSGCDTANANSCTVNMNNSRSVSALFTPLETLSVSKLGTGKGSIAISSPSSPVASCDSTCSYSFVQTTTVSLTATPNPGNIFTGWSGACSGKGACNVTMSLPLSVSATFVPDITPVLNLLLND